MEYWYTRQTSNKSRQPTGYKIKTRRIERTKNDKQTQSNQMSEKSTSKALQYTAQLYTKQESVKVFAPKEFIPKVNDFFKDAFND